MNKQFDTLSNMKIENPNETNPNILAFTKMTDNKLFWTVLNTLNTQNSAWINLNNQNIDETYYYVLHEKITNTIYIRTGKELKEKGLYVFLEGFETQVFEVYTNNKSFGVIPNISEILNGKGVRLDESYVNIDYPLILKNIFTTLNISELSSRFDIKFMKYFNNDNFDIYTIDNKTDLFVIENFNSSNPNISLSTIIGKQNTENKFVLIENILDETISIVTYNQILKNVKEKFYKIKKLKNSILCDVLFEQAKGKSFPIKNSIWQTVVEDKNEYVDILDHINKKDLSAWAENWVEKNTPELIGKKIVYMSMEMFIPELYETIDGSEHNGAVDANFNGGLGILAGCTMEGFKSIGLDVCSIIPLYRDRMVQSINFDLHQNIEQQKIDYSKTKNLYPIIDENTNKQLVITINAMGKDRHVKIWKTYRFGAEIFMLECDEVFDVIYTGDRNQRLLQEIVVGKITPILLKKLNIRPSILHFNEAHTILAAVHVNEWKKTHNDNLFDDTRILFTIHTPRLAGMEVFYVDYHRLEIPDEYREYFDPKHENKMDFTNIAMHFADRVNTVSDNQIRVVNERIFGNKQEFTRKIIGIMNGSSSSYWMSDSMQKFINIDDDNINLQDFMNSHDQNKQEVSDAFSNMMITQDMAKKLSIDDSQKLQLNMSRPSAWAVRRIVDYKSQWPLIKDIIRVICAEKNTLIETQFGKYRGLGMQVVIGGMAHPNDHERQEWVHEFCMWMKGKWRNNLKSEYIDAPELIGNFFFLPASTFGLGKVLKMFAKGCDICLEIPEWDEEACGTSGMRALGHGSPCVESSDGALEWGIDGINAFMLKPHTPEKLLECLEKFSNFYYEWQNEKNKPAKKLEHYNLIMMKKNSFLTWKHKVNIDIMSERYAKEMFSPTILANQLINE